jgi:toxin ParE1/3/4
VLVKWLARALANLEAEANYIARDNPRAAARIVQTINKAAQRFQRFPALGRPGRVAGTRELVVPGTPTSFLIVYDKGS